MTNDALGKQEAEEVDRMNPSEYVGIKIYNILPIFAECVVGYISEKLFPILIVAAGLV